MVLLQSVRVVVDSCVASDIQLCDPSLYRLRSDLPIGLDSDLSIYLSIGSHLPIGLPTSRVTYLVESQLSIYQLVG